MNSALTELPCKLGDRARIVNSAIEENNGKVVLVVKPYRRGAIVSGTKWFGDGHLWVTLSLSGVLKSVGLWTKEIDYDRGLTGVCPDVTLRPLLDNEGGVEDAQARSRKAVA